MSGTLHAAGRALRHPEVVSDSLSNITARLPHDLSEGVGHLRHGLGQSLRALHESIAWNLSTLGDELRHFKLSDLPDALDVWLHDVVRRSVMWPVPRWPMYVFMAGAMTCLFLSALCHLIGCCSKHVSAVIWRFDYAGAHAASPPTTTACHASCWFIRRSKVMSLVSHDDDGMHTMTTCPSHRAEVHLNYRTGYVFVVCRPSSFYLSRYV
jgi:Haemolysin-III related